VGKKKKEGRAYVVVRLGWDECYGADRSFILVQSDDDDCHTLGRPLALFLDKAKAQARRDELERRDRAELNPFLFIGGEEYRLEDVTSLTPAEFAKRMKEIAPKSRLPRANKYDERDWFGWWESNADNLTEAQRQAVWGLLDKLRLYAVMTAEVET
jgi:hypothetical protein